MILSKQKSSFNKNRVGFNLDRSLGKISKNRTKLNQPIYKCSLCKNLGHLELFWYDKLTWSKENNNFGPLTTTNTLEQKKYFGTKGENLILFCRVCFAALKMFIGKIW